MFIAVVVFILGDVVHLEDLTTQELVKYTLRIVKHEYEGQTAGILGQQRRGSGRMDTPHRMHIRRKRVDRESDDGVAGQGGSERVG